MKTIPLLLIACWFVTTAKIAPAAELEPGLVGEYFDLGAAVEEFPKLEGKKPALKRVDKTINFRSTGPTFPGTKLDNRFAIRWSGKIKLPIWNPTMVRGWSSMAKPWWTTEGYTRCRNRTALSSSKLERTR